MYRNTSLRPGTVLWIGLACLLLVAGCKSSEPAAAPAPDATEYEDFDPSAYPDQVPDRRVEVVHDVPEELLEGTTRGSSAETGPRTGSGFRIQSASEQSRDRANRILRDADLWLRSLDEGQPGAGLPLYIEWDQPYWKVRVGNFRGRSSANEVLAVIRREYPAAFVVPSVIQIQ